MQRVERDRALLSLDEAACMLGIARRTLEREIQREAFPRPLKIRGRTLVPVSDVHAYVNDRIEEARSP